MESQSLRPTQRDHDFETRLTTGPSTVLMAIPQVRPLRQLSQTRHIFIYLPSLKLTDFCD
ncbi:hypothetical protein PCASD_00995 [Puccinia coronata f. sp. avenae]|uniref:Uncharacterized protein n=1 Tax=Puccinia coronata f. sp. avenae TaxID=200324 RepID=A0A2N5VMR9_9BASI|nr:hypothetical protein PCASD_00995 [Puccinia coronata f. sp. avenae]